MEKENGCEFYILIRLVNPSQKSRIEYAKAVKDLYSLIFQSKDKGILLLAIKRSSLKHKVTLHVATVKKTIKIRCAFTSLFLLGLARGIFARKTSYYSKNFCFTMCTHCVTECDIFPDSFESNDLFCGKFSCVCFFRVEQAMRDQPSRIQTAFAPNYKSNPSRQSRGTRETHAVGVEHFARNVRLRKKKSLKRPKRG